MNNILYRSVCFFLAFIFFPVFLEAQTYVWSKSVGGSGFDTGYSLALDSSGNIFLCGGYSATVDFDPGAGTDNFISKGNKDIFITKYSNNGTYQWTKSIGGIGYDFAFTLKIDHSGNIFLTGSFSDTVDFDPGIGVAKLISNGQMDMFVAKYDHGGNFIWAKGFGGTSYDYSYSIALDSSSNCYISGYFFNTVDFDPGINVFNINSFGNTDLFFAKYDSSGNFLWAKNIGGTADDFSYSLQLDQNNNIYVSGGIKGTVDCDPGISTVNLSSNGLVDVFIGKYDSNGNYIWAKSFGGTSIDEPFWNLVDPSGNVYITGGFQGTVDFDAGTGVANINGNPTADIFIAKYDSAGNYVWAKGIGGSTSYDLGMSMALDQWSDLYITGGFEQTVDFDPGVGVANLTSAGARDMFVAKYDSAGNYIWAKRIGGANHDSGSNSLYVDANGSIYVTGIFQLSIDLDFGAGSAIHTSNGLDDIFLAKYSQCLNPDVPVIIASDTNVCDGNTTNLSIVGNLKSATRWKWYDGGCGINPIDSGTVITPTISATTTYYARGEGGCIVSPGGCGNIVINHVTDCVWPGDANSDMIANNIDLLAIGVGYGKTGPARNDTSTAWVGQSCTDWADTLLSGANYKHIDCNGDSTINDNDTVAIYFNYGQTHLKKQPDFPYIASNPDLHFVTSANQFAPGSWVDAEIWVGDNANPVLNMYGVAFDLSFNYSLVEAGTVSLSYPNSWLGNPGVNSIKLTHIDELSGVADGALVRTDHINKNGFGKIAVLRFQAKSSISTLSTLNFNFSNYEAIDSSGALQTLNLVSDSVTIDPALIGINDYTSREIKIYPNPNQGSFSISSGKGTYAIINQLGQTIKSFELNAENNYFVEIKELPIGIYFIRGLDSCMATVQKLIVTQ